MFFKQITRKLLFLVLILSTFSAFGMQPALDYASRHKGKIAAGVGAVAALGSLYYGYQQGWFSGDGVNVQVDGVQIVGNPNLWTHEHREERQFNIENNAQVQIGNSVGNIDIVDYDGAVIKLLIHKRAETAADLNTIYAEITESPRQLVVKTKYTQPIIKALINYKLQLPRDKAISVIAANSSGNINAENVNGQLRAKTSSGHIVAKNINGATNCESSSGSINVEIIKGNFMGNASSGQINAKNITENAFIGTSSGDVDILNLAKNLNAAASSGRVTAKKVGGDARVYTSSGDIYVENNGKFEATASSGDVTLKQNNINSSVFIQTSSGSVTLQAQAINAHLLTRMSSGRINSAFPLNNRIQGKEAKKRVDAILGNGGPDIKIETSSGNIRLQQN